MPFRRIPAPEIPAGPPLPLPLPAIPATSSTSHGCPAEPPPGEPQPASYDVGYRKPPLHSRFKPGRSGNCKGRPRSAKGLKTIARETLTQKVAVRTATGEKKISRIEAIIHKTIEQAMKGNQRALAELLKLYVAAVPDTPIGAEGTTDEDLSNTDLAVLEELKALMGGGGEA